MYKKGIQGVELSKIKVIVSVLVVFNLSACGGGSGTPAAAGDEEAVVSAIQRVSIATDGTESNIRSVKPVVSQDGRYVVYSSESATLVADDTNMSSDIFMFDTQTRITTRVSVGNDGSEANGHIFDPAISADGRYIVFESRASNLVANDLNSSMDVFLRDTQLNTTTLVSKSSDGTQGGSASLNADISADGRYVIYQSFSTNLVANDTNVGVDIFKFDTQTSITTRVSLANNGSESNLDSFNAAISADGRYVVFEANATNLVIGDLNMSEDIFLRDTQLNTTILVSKASDGSQGDLYSYEPDISADGRYVVYASIASTLVANDTNMAIDVFKHDILTGITTRISVASDGAESNLDSSGANMSADGRYIVFESIASNLVPNISNLVSNIFVRDTMTNTTTLVSKAYDGTQGNQYSIESEISADGNFVVFTSVSSNLVSGDTNNVDDVFHVSRP